MTSAKNIDSRIRTRIVVIESPYAAPTPEGVARHVDYARRAVMDCVRRRESPYAGHLLLTQVLDDKIPEQRALGIECHLTFIRRVDALVVYQDLGISKGMQMAIEEAQAWGVPIEHREIGEGER